MSSRAAEALKEGGVLAAAIEGFTPRAVQQEMAEAIEDNADMLLAASSSSKRVPAPARPLPISCPRCSRGAA